MAFEWAIPRDWEVPVRARIRQPTWLLMLVMLTLMSDKIDDDCFKLRGSPTSAG